MGWRNVLKVPEDADIDPDYNKRNILEKFGEITLEQIHKHASTYYSYKPEMHRTVQ